MPIRSLLLAILFTLSFGCAYEGPGEIQFSVAFDDQGCGAQRAQAWVNDSSSAQPIEADLVIGDRLTGMLYGFPAGKQRLVQVEVVDQLDLPVFSGSLRVDVGEEVVRIDHLELVPESGCAQRIARAMAVPEPSPLELSPLPPSPTTMTVTVADEPDEADQPTSVSQSSGPSTVVARSQGGRERIERAEQQAPPATGKSRPSEAHYASVLTSFQSKMDGMLSEYRGNCVGKEYESAGDKGVWSDGRFIKTGERLNEKFKGATPECRALEGRIESGIGATITVYQRTLAKARQTGIDASKWRAEMNRVGWSDPDAVADEMRQTFDSIKEGR